MLHENKCCVIRVFNIEGGARKNCSMPTRLRFLFLLATIFGGSVLILSVNKISKIVFLNNVVTIDFIRYNVLTSFNETGYTIKTKGCTIPAFKPLGEEIKELVGYPKAIKECPNANFPLIESNITHIWVKNENKRRYNISSDKNLICCYKSFNRPVTIIDITMADVDERVNYSECIDFSNSVKVEDEFVKVECSENTITVYQQYFLFTPKKNMSVTSNDIVLNRTTYNVIVMGIDAVSRLNFYRTMPNTLSFLKDKGAIELLGYNKVGDNSFPNLVPMLMGLSEQDLNTTCIPNKRSTFDNCPFIWEWFKQVGYYTAFGEDISSLGTFNYEQNGFIRTPTDYYIHTFMNEAENNVGTNKDFNSFLCMNDKYFYTVLLDYIQSLTTTLKSNKLFGFFWEVTMSHDYLNYPMKMDIDYANLLKRLYSSKYLDETILVVASDHGIRWGDIRSTNQGRLEERLPFVYILTPPKFRDTYIQAYKNLKTNSHRLSTPYDLHATLFDLVNMEQIEDNMISLRSNQSYINHNRGISLFLPIPTNRTCTMAHIADHWCSCHKGKKLSTKGKKAAAVAGELVKQINLLLYDYRQCATLQLVEVVSITEMEVNSPENDKFEWREYMLVIRTEPGKALFEATLRNNSQTWSLAGTISRLNLYGNQSRCIHNYLLKLYCYCIQ